MNLINGFHRNKKIILGIELLRFICCFWVVILHCSKIKKAHKNYLNKGFHVPIFTVISFYFYYPNIEKRIITKIKTRFERLLYPYICWAFFRFILNKLLVIVTSNGYFEYNLTLKELFIQLIIGAKFHAIFWFLFNLIFISLILTIISFLFKSKTILILQLIAIFCFYIHFYKINLYLFNNFRRGVQITIGAIVEILPLSILGCYLSSIKLLSITNKLVFSNQLILFLLIVFIFRFNIFWYYAGFMYPNIFQNILSSIIIVSEFSSINLDRYIKVQKIIKYITKYTGGIYYIHSLFFSYLKKYFVFFSEASYNSSFAIYIISYFTCFIGSLIFKNLKLKYLFM